jgi:hypothetical protein
MLPETTQMEAPTKTIRFALGSLLFVAFFASASMAQVQRTFVSGLGNDGNPCNRTAPCRTFTQALTGTNAGGEVIVLDSAGYGSFTITQPVSVIAPPGIYAGISVFSGDGVSINAGANDTVILRGLTVNNQGSTGNGIVFNTGGTLHIESCVANGFNNDLPVGSGILISGPGNVFVKDTIARGNQIGVLVNRQSEAIAKVAIDRVQLDGNSRGLNILAVGSGAVVHAAIRNSSASGNGVVGIFGEAFTSGTALLDVESCLMTNNSDGIETMNSIASISNCTITQNSGFGFVIATGGAILTRGNNTIGGSNFGNLTPVAAQ